MTLEKFKLLCWKNFTLQKRSPWAGLTEIIFPVLVVAIFVAVRHNIDPNVQKEIKFESFKPSSANCMTNNGMRIRSIGVSPSDNPALTQLVDSSIGDSFEVTYFGNASALDSFLSSQNDSELSIAVGIEFDNRLAVSLYSCS